MANQKKTPRKVTENQRIKKRTAESKELLLKQLCTVPIIQAACAKAKVDRSTFYRWQNEDTKFKEESQNALRKGLEYMNDVAESKVLQGVHKGNKTFVIYWLKHHHTAYADKLTHYHAATLIAPTEVKGELSDEQRERIAKGVNAWKESIKRISGDEFVYEHPETTVEKEDDKKNSPERMIKIGKKNS